MWSRESTKPVNCLAIGFETVSKSTLQAGLVGRQIDTVACVNTGSEA